MAEKIASPANRPPIMTDIPLGASASGGPPTLRPKVFLLGAGLPTPPTLRPKVSLGFTLTARSKSHEGLPPPSVRGPFARPTALRS
jgi:hypothetical protein